MISTSYNFERLNDFLEEHKRDIYKEPVDNGHFTKGGIESIKDRIKPLAKVLDVGCGPGVALAIFKELGAEPIGITLCEEEAMIAKSKGYDVRIMDMSFMDFDDEYFDIVWARHSLEHSMFPFFTLSELHRVLKKEGTIYLEMPGIKTDAHHESNFNHYSVFESNMWANLLLRSGFVEIEPYILSFDLMDYETKNIYGKDEYYRFIATKPMGMPDIIKLAL